MHGISTPPWQKGKGLSDSKKQFTMPEPITTSELIV
jgi:hypothetical protein